MERKINKTRARFINLCARDVIRGLNLNKTRPHIILAVRQVGSGVHRRQPFHCRL